MRPIVISDTIQEFEGVRYYLWGKYFGGKGRRLHRVVWEYHRGPIPAGYQVHHKDNDPSNNDVGNLECLTPREHLGGRHGEESGKRGLKSIKKAGIAAAEWHSTRAGKQWHREQYELHCAPAIHAEREITCRYCGSPATVRNHNGDFCSNACKSAWRRTSGTDDEQRDCAVCGKAFTVNRYKKTKCCSVECGAISSAQARAGVSQGRRGRKGRRLLPDRSDYRLLRD